MRQSRERFDSNADSFDDRAGIPAEACGAIAAAVVELASAGPDDVLLEIGAGTGAIGCHLTASVRYVGVDRSSAMLGVFAGRAHAGRAHAGRAHAGGASLVQCEADETWPVRDARVGVVFASRVAHLLDADHLVAELRRTCRPGAFFLAGRVVRDRDAPRSRLRRRRQQLMRERGMTPRRGEQATQLLLDRLVASGGEAIGPRTAAVWTVDASLGDILEGWSSMTTMGDVEVPAATRDAMMRELRDWAEQELGDLRRLDRSEEGYVLSGVRI